MMPPESPQMNLLSKALLSLIAIHFTILHVIAGNIPTIDPAFTNRFAELKQAAGFVEQPTDDIRNEWRPNLQLWVGVKAVEGKKQTVYFVQLTTLPTPATNIWGEAWQPALRTNNFGWSGTNKSATPKRAEYIHPLYP